MTDVPDYSLDRVGVLLSLQRALVGQVPPTLRGVLVALTVDVEARMICYFDGVIAEDDEEDVQCAYTEVLADFPDYDIHLEIHRLDTPIPLPKIPEGAGHWVYMRSGEFQLHRSK